MARKRPNATGRNHRSERFVAIEHYMIASTAFKSLSSNAVKILVLLTARYNGSNNGSITFSARDGQENGIGKDPTCRALDELQDKGFLRCTRRSSFNTNNRKAREWALTTKPEGTSEKATKEFMSWKPGPEDKPRQKREAVQRADWKEDAIKNNS